MEKSVFQKGIGIITALMLFAATFMPVVSFGASTFPDVKGHWAESYIDRAVKQGFIEGYTDGRFRPEQKVSRAEFVSMINRALGNSETDRISFVDVPYGAWYYQDVAKAVRASYVKGFNDGTFKPGQSITRQEAAVMIAKIIPTYGYSGRLQNYPDYRSIGSWANDALSKVNGKGYINGYSDGKMHPLDPLTRAQAAKIIGDILINENVKSADPMIKKDGTKLSNAIYPNGVTVHKDLADSNASIDNCVVLGTLSVQGGGSGTLTLNNCRIVNASVNRTADTVRLLAKGETTIENLSGKNSFILQTSNLSGGNFGSGFEKISIAEDAKAILKGTFPYVSIDGPYADVKLESGTVNDLTITASGRRSDVTASKGTTIKSASVYAESYFRGEGTISNMQVYAKNITYETKPKAWTIGSGGSTPTKSDPLLDISFSPKNGETGVYLDNKITITFSHEMKKYNGNALAASDIEDIVSLRKGSSSGAAVPFKAGIDSAKKVITITPSKNLDSNTKYYVRVKEDMMRDSYGNYNKEAVSHFTTGDTTLKLIVTFNPENGAVDVPVDIGSFTIAFSDKIIRYDGSSIDSNTDRYLKNSVVTFQKGSSAVKADDYSVSINSARRIITVTPDKKLDLNTKYTVGIKASALKTAAKTSVSAASASFTTAGMPVLSEGSATVYEKAIDLKVKSNVNGIVYAVVTNKDAKAPDKEAIKSGVDGDGKKVISKVNATVKASNTAILNFSGLDTDTAYEIYTVLYDGNNNASAVTAFENRTLPLHLVSLSVKVKNKDALENFNPRTLKYDVVVPAGTAYVTVKANAGSFPGTITIDGVIENSADIELTDKERTIEITVQETGKKAVTYTVHVKEERDTRIKEISINGIPYTIGEKFILESSSQTSATLSIVTMDSNALVFIENNEIENPERIILTISEETESVCYKVTIKNGDYSADYSVCFERSDFDS